MSELKDLTGKRFGKLTVIDRAPSKITPKGQHKTMWNCVCDCGNASVVGTTNLLSGHTKSCGCLQKTSRLGHIRDLTGQKFGRLTVVKRAEDMYDKFGRHTMWECPCECGKTTIVGTSTLTCGVTKSCGCYKSEVTSKRAKTHGMSKTRLYGVWRTMLSRCYNENTKKYKLYGDRGIQVCDEWHKFENFYEWTISNGYDENADFGECTIDRINNDGNYCPENCRWATRLEQANNTRTNHFLEWNNENHTISQWANIVGINRRTISERINSGWSVEDALTIPIKT